MVEVEESGYRDGWSWVNLGGCGWRRVKIYGDGWEKWMEVVGVGGRAAAFVGA